MKKLIAASSFATSLHLVSFYSYSAALWLPEQAADDMGLASSGRAALGIDASAAANNPAAMTRLSGNHLSGGVLMLVVESEFDTESATYDGSNGGDAGDVIPAGSVAYVHSYSDRLKFGAAAGSYFGLGLDYGRGWTGRYYADEAELVTMGVTTSVGYKLTDTLSLGVGVSLVYSELTQKVSVRNLLPTQTDGKLDLEADDMGWGYYVGMLYEPDKTLRMGATYRSEIELNYEDTASVSNILPPLSNILETVGLLRKPIDLEMNLPQAVLISAVYQFHPDWHLTTSANWQDWSAFGETSISVKGENTTNLVQDRNFDDTYGASVGLMYRISDIWHWRVGFAYDQSAVSSSDRTPDLPVDRQVRYATGFKYHLKEDMDIGFAYTFADLGDARINQLLENNPLRGELVGEYDTNHVHFFNIHMNYRF